MYVCHMHIVTVNVYYYFCFNVFLVPFLYLLTNFIVQSFANEWPRIVIHRLVMTCSSSILYGSYLVGMLWAITSQQDRIDSDLITSFMMSWRMLVPGVIACAFWIFKCHLTTSSINSIRWYTCNDTTTTINFQHTNIYNVMNTHIYMYYSRFTHTHLQTHALSHRPCRWCGIGHLDRSGQTTVLCNLTRTQVLQVDPLLSSQSVHARTTPA